MKTPTALRATAALSATEKMLPDAIHACRVAQEAYDAALEAGRDTPPYRAALQQALAQKKAIHAAIHEKQALINQRREDKISAVAAALTAAAQDALKRLLESYAFTLTQEKTH